MIRKGISLVALGWAVSASSFLLRFPRLLVTRSLSAGVEVAHCDDVNQIVNQPPKKMPITVISGFLGAGKTTFLQRILHEDNGLKFGLLVNDMAAVNIDAKLIKKQTQGEFNGVDTLELQNGCVCCTLAEDTMLSISKLISLAYLRNIQYDHIIIECSGIAEPRKIRANFHDFEEGGTLANSIKLDTLITIVDSTEFIKQFGTASTIADAPYLAVKPAVPSTNTYMEDSSSDTESKARKITELLLEQVECADIVIINKCDLLRNPTVEIPMLKALISSINPTAKVLDCVRGNLPNPLSVLGAGKGVGAADIGILEEHKHAVAEADKSAHCTLPHIHGPHCTSTHHHRDHDRHTHSTDGHGVGSGCRDTQDKEKDIDCHHHSQHHHCSHDHSHDHNHDVGRDNNDHDNHDDDITTAQKRFGITSFVYRRRRPFHPVRFATLLKQLGQVSIEGLETWFNPDTPPTTASSSSLPSSSTSSLSSSLSSSLESSTTIESSTAASGLASQYLLRSKGFVWIATSKRAAYYVSHAGQHLELTVLGRWWADMNPKDWPTQPELLAEIQADFDGDHGDRRQEIVFIGNFDQIGAENSPRMKLEQMLDACLLSDEEMIAYDIACTEPGDQGLKKIVWK